MSSILKPILGIAAIFYAPVLAPILLSSVGVAATAGAIAIASAGIILVGASLVGSSTTDSMSSAVDTMSVESYAGAKLQTIKSNTAPVPIVYGRHKLAGNIIFEATNAAFNSDSATNGYNRDYWALIVFSGHDIHAAHDTYSGEETLTTVQGIAQTSTNEYVHVKQFSTTSGSVNLQSLNFVKNEAGDYLTGSQLGFASVTIPANLSGYTVHQVFDGEENKNTQLRNITVDRSFKKIRTITNATTISTAETYSINPAEILLDLLGDALSIPDTDIDIATFYQAKTDCAANSWTCNLALIQQANIQSIIADVLATCRGKIFHSESKWKCKIDTKSQSVADTLTSDDVLGNSLSISMAGTSTIANKVIVKYINPSDEWLSAESVKEDSTLQTYDGQTIQKILDIKGITSATHAAQISEIALNSLRYSEDASANRVKQTPLAISFATSVKNAHLEVGDVISLNHTLLDRVRQFLLLSTMTDQSGVIQISSREYCETHFKNTSGVYLI